MECRDAQFYLRIRRPGTDELGADVSVRLDRHLASCPDCSADSRTAASFDAAVAVAMHNVPVPDGLRDRLVSRGFAQRGSALRLRVYRAAALAASVLLTAGLAIGVFTVTRPKPDLTTLVHKTDRIADPNSAEDEVRQWLVAQGLPPDLPEPFDYGFLVTIGKEEVQGRDVPVVVFRNGAGVAKVYSFRSTQFDLKDVQEAQASYSQAKPYPDRVAGVTYVIVFTGESLNPFLRGHGMQVAFH